MKHLLELLAFYILAVPFAILPHGFALAAGRLTGRLLHAAMPSRRKTAIANIERSRAAGADIGTEDAAGIVRRLFENVGSYMPEIARLHFGMDKQVLSSVAVAGYEHFDEAKARGNGVIILSSHYGNWELMVSMLPSVVGPMCISAKRQKNPYLDRMIVGLRQKRGAEQIFKEGAVKRFLAELKRGGTVGFILDEFVEPSNGAGVKFLGLDAYMNSFAASLSKRTGAPIVPTFIKKTGNGHRLVFSPPLDITGDPVEDTASMARMYEGLIAEDPAQWLLWLRRWKWLGKAAS